MCVDAGIIPTVKLMDFGLARHTQSSAEGARTSDCEGLGPGGLMTTPVGTPGFVAPEVIENLPYGKEVDVFACGVILYWLLSGCLPFDHPDTAQMMEMIKRTEFGFPPEQWRYVSKEAISLISNLLDRSPYSRISTSNALSHPWVLGNKDDTIIRNVERIGGDNSNDKG